MYGTREFRFSFTDTDGQSTYMMGRNQWQVMQAVKARGLDPATVKRAPFEKKARLTTGHCQICGREIGTTRGIIAHHGYTRPGHGWQTSSCFGARYVEYAVGHDALDDLIPIIKAQLKHHTELLAMWKDNPPTTITCTRDGKYDFATRKYEKISVTLERPADFDPKAEVSRYIGRDGYASHYKMNIVSMEFDVRTDQQDLAHFTQRRNEWKKL